MKKLAKISMISVMALMLVLPVLVSAQTINDPIVPPSGPTLTLDRMETLVRAIGTWLIMIAIVVAVIMIVWGGVTYMLAQGDDTKVKAAQGRIWSGIIGAAIVLAVGLILRTLAALISQTFFA